MHGWLAILVKLVWSFATPTVFRPCFVFLDFVPYLATTLLAPGFKEYDLGCYFDKFSLMPDLMNWSR